MYFDLNILLFRESIEDGFSSSRLVVTADLGGDDSQHPYFNSYTGYFVIFSYSFKLGFSYSQRIHIKRVNILANILDAFFPGRISMRMFDSFSR